MCLLKKHKKHDVYLLGDLFNVEERREMVNKLSEMVQKQYLKLKELVEINYKNVNTVFIISILIKTKFYTIGFPFL